MEPENHGSVRAEYVFPGHVRWQPRRKFAAQEDINYFDPAIGARPNPNFGNITLQTDSGFSSYNALQLSFICRTGKVGLSFQANYTFGHAIDDVEDPGGFRFRPPEPQQHKSRERQQFR